jgi:TRAP-type C4-dicarboxylate transport system permease small subunit
MLRFAFATLPRWALGTLMMLGVAINFANVIGRYVFGHALFWAEEVMVFITIWGVFIGLAAITYGGDHLNMDLFSSAIRGPWRIVVNGFVAAVMIACCVFVALQSYHVVTLFAQTKQVSVGAEVPKASPHAALLAGFALAALAVVVRIRSYLTGKF